MIPAVASQAEAIARGIEVIAERLRNGGRLVYVGAGTSGRLGVLDATECPPTFNAPPGLVVGVIAGGSTALTRAVEGAEDRPEYASRDLTSISLSAADVLVGIATSGRTPYVLGAVDYARSLGAFTIGLSCNPDSDIIGRVDLAITPVVGPEVLSGSTRLKAGTATKLVLNMLSTGAMVRLGKTFGNLMVDLRATNEKLKHRTNRIVREATGLDRAEADALLDRCCTRTQDGPRFAARRGNGRGGPRTVAEGQRPRSSRGWDERARGHAERHRRSRSRIRRRRNANRRGTRGAPTGRRLADARPRRRRAIEPAGGRNTRGTGCSRRGRGRGVRGCREAPQSRSRAPVSAWPVRAARRIKSLCVSGRRGPNWPRPWT